MWKYAIFTQTVKGRTSWRSERYMIDCRIYKRNCISLVTQRNCFKSNREKYYFDILILRKTLFTACRIAQFHFWMQITDFFFLFFSSFLSLLYSKERSKNKWKVKVRKVIYQTAFQKMSKMKDFSWKYWVNLFLKFGWLCIFIFLNNNSHKRCSRFRQRFFSTKPFAILLNSVLNIKSWLCKFKLKLYFDYYFILRTCIFTFNSCKPPK